MTRTLLLSALGVVAPSLMGCGPDLPPSAELAEFLKAGPAQPTVDLSSVVKAKVPEGPYRVVPGDILGIRGDLGPIFRSETRGVVEEAGPIMRRVGSDGKIWLPMIDQTAVTGKTAAEIEAALVEAYHPKHLMNRPNVIVQVAEYSTRYVDITGAVGAPGRYQLRSDEMSLVALLMRAGNIQPSGAGVVRITRAGEKDANMIVLPVKGMNIPFVDVALSGGETVVVDKLNPRVFTVLGLINAPGTYPYPPDVSLNLIEGLGMARGVNPVGDPRYVTIYREDAGGKALSARFQINRKSWFVEFLSDNTLGGGAFMPLKPGDVICVEEDARTRARTIFAQVFSLRIGAGAGAYTQATYYRDYSQTGTGTARRE